MLPTALVLGLVCGAMLRRRLLAGALVGLPLAFGVGIGWSEGTIGIGLGATAVALVNLGVGALGGAGARSVAARSRVEARR